MTEKGNEGKAGQGGEQVEKELTEEELMAKLAALGEITEEQRNSIVCALIGHSNIHTYFFGYHYCARCGAQVGDSLAGVYFNPSEVIVGHKDGNCPVCRANYEKMGWQDRLFCPDPFKPQGGAS